MKKESEEFYNIREIISGIYKIPEIRKTTIPLLIGNPGLAKTTIVNELAKEWGVNCLTEIASTKMPHEFSGICIPDYDNKIMTYFNYDKLLNLKDGDILFLDEILNANPMILNAFLTVLENRTLPSGKKLADIMIIAAANRQGASILTPQIKERFVFYSIEFDQEGWSKHMEDKYDMYNPITELLSVKIKEEKFSAIDENYMSPRSVDRAVNMIIHNVVTPYEKKIKHILNTLITNHTDTPVVTKSGKVLLAPGQKMPWLELIRYRKGIIELTEEKTENCSF